ncbi:DUF1254 domain-containing protein [Pelomonas sp. P7]|uniref:DUF1254 domain-containing protein n=1 Tax=Pelomonas caseinilytica TaxID=2906763 RepID=A0ABS8XNS6_9BURK|nr:DUF1254 domain-containing protein [Pelomonas sp. P7]MCE4538860.1 DUF1254 domain-containing protein [Pelomonas sp. P7]
MNPSRDQPAAPPRLASSPAPMARRTWRRRRGLVAAVLAVPALAAALLAAQADMITLGAEAYLYGYPLLIVDASRDRITALAAPANVLHRMRQFPDAGFKEVVRPNVDTLYTSAFIDTARGPCLFEMPANAERYEVMPFMDAWTNVFATLGTRTEGTGGGRYWLVGPGVAPPPDDGLPVMRSPTRWAWLIGRTQTNGSGDYETVHRLQDGLRLRCDGAQRGAAAPEEPWPAGPATPREAVDSLATREFFRRLAALMLDNPPAAADAPLLRRLEGTGFKPGHAPDWGLLDLWSLSLGRAIADHRVAQALASTQGLRNGWSTPPQAIGDYGTDYPTRAAVAMVGLGANLPQDAVYMSARLDAQGQALQGSRRYRLHFAPQELPPVKAFWSITAYGADEFLIANPQQRYALGDRDPLVRNADGSLDLWVQAEQPAAERRPNWLPVQAGQPFQLVARLYWPRHTALSGAWQMPALERLD